MIRLLCRALVALVLGLGVGLSVSALAQAPKPTPPAAAKPAAPQLRGFATPEAAADALTDAIRKNDDKEIAAILGMSWNDLVPGSDYQDEEARQQFLKAWDASHKIIMEGTDKALVGAGTTGWVSPIPIVKLGNEWRYDVEAGRREMEARLIGRDERAVIQTLLAIVDAQRDYAALDPMKTGLPAYARRLVSSPGRMDGLYWESQPGQPESPLGPLLARAQTDDIQENGYYGYRFRLLYSQGPDAPGGAYDYLVKNRMLGGFAVIAWPVQYGVTGVMTFMVSHNSDVVEKDLGVETQQKAAAINVFNPDKTWEKADMTPDP